MGKYPTSTSFTLDFKVSVFENGSGNDLVKQLQKYKNAICHREGGDNLNPEYVNRLARKHTHCYVLSNTQSIRYTQHSPTVTKRLPVAFVFVEIKTETQKARLLLACCLQRAKGAGRRLVHFVLNDLKEKGITHSVVEAVMNAKVLLLYESFGFVNKNTQKDTYTESSEDDTSSWLELDMETFTISDAGIPTLENS